MTLLYCQFPPPFPSPPPHLLKRENFGQKLSPPECKNPWVNSQSAGHPLDRSRRLPYMYCILGYPSNRTSFVAVHCTLYCTLAEFSGCFCCTYVLDPDQGSKETSLWGLQNIVTSVVTAVMCCLFQWTFCQAECKNYFELQCLPKKAQRKKLLETLLKAFSGKNVKHFSKMFFIQFFYMHVLTGLKYQKDAFFAKNADET